MLELVEEAREDPSPVLGSPRWHLRRELGGPRRGVERGLESGRGERDAGALYRAMGKSRSGVHLVSHRTNIEGVSTKKPSHSLVYGSSVWEPSDKEPHHGGVFGLDFSPEGSILGVACERQNILLFDPLRAARIGQIPNAHGDCVNTVRFLDSRTMASCSDDQSVRLWDLRHTSRPRRTLRAHGNWVKNVEFARDAGLLLSSAFDGYVYAWDVNDEPQRIFYSPGLMRMRLSPDSSKMILSTQWGYILTLHNLHFPTLPAQLFGFKPNMYWLMLKSGTSFASSAEFLPRFTADQNRTELILDFPENCDPDNISSLAPHPSNTCVVSRSTNHDEQSEWTCVHDLRVPEEVEEEDGRCRHTSGGQVKLCASQEFQPMRRRSESIITLQMENDGSSDDSDLPIFEDDQMPTISTTEVRGSSSEESIVEQGPAEQSGSGEGRRRSREPSGPRRESSGVTLNLSLRTHQVNAQISLHPNNWRSDPRAFFIRTGPANSGNRTLIVLGGAATPPSPSQAGDPGEAESRSKSATPTKEIGYPPVYNRLMHYAEEPRVGRGFIKEQCWSPDGRVLASPFAFGVRLLAFDERVSLLPHYHQPPSPLTEIGSLVKRHESVVLCTRFSPTHSLLVSGDHRGRLVFTHPRF